MGVAFGLLFFVIFAVWLGGIVYWIVALVEVAKIPDHQYRAAGTDKTVWILVVALTGVIGALIWLLAKRSDVRAAAGRLPAAPAGWYPQPDGGLRWWDGAQWTQFSHLAPPNEH
jgi:hypothetical protein